MRSDAPVVPDESQMLCEGCGYVLSGLSGDSRCPECGKLIAESIAEDLRRLPAWEQTEAGRARIASFCSTTAAVLFRPGHFYRNLATRRITAAPRRFARIHWLATSALLGMACALHADWYDRSMLNWQVDSVRLLSVLGPVLAAGTYLFLHAITWMAAKLTAWEAAYRGLRLPFAVVMRGLHYHAAHYLPVALMAAATIGGYRLALCRGYLDVTAATTYLYVLCGEVVLAAIYLFETYWVGMRNMMFANR